MISEVLTTGMKSLGIGFIVSLVSVWLGTDYVINYFQNNLITVLVALLAINATTIGIVLTKIRDLVDRSDVPDAISYFSETRSQMLLSIKEQISLIVIASVALIIESADKPEVLPHLNLLLQSIIVATFAYALFVLYDTAKGVLIIVDYENGSDS